MFNYIKKIYIPFRLYLVPLKCNGKEKNMENHFLRVDDMGNVKERKYKKEKCEGKFCNIFPTTFLNN